MSIEIIKNYIFEILDETGIFVDLCDFEKDLDLREYIVDSLQYVYFIVELESRLGIELPNEILLYENLMSINGFANMVFEFYKCETSDSVDIKDK